MIVLTVDRRGSRRRADDVATTASHLEETWKDTLLIPVARFAGDELQLVTDDGETAVGIALALTRDDAWSVGIGFGSGTVSDESGASTGPAFFAARDAIEHAKRSTPRLAVRSEPVIERAPNDRDIAAVLGLVVDLRARRSPQGWEVADLLQLVGSQKAVAGELGITPAAVSARARAAGLRAESAAVATLGRMANELNGSLDG